MGRRVIPGSEAAIWAPLGIYHLHRSCRRLGMGYVLRRGRPSNPLPRQFSVCGSSWLASFLDKAVAVCNKLGLPVAPSKVIGPSTILTFLGIELDTINQVIRLPQDKLTTLKYLLREWQGRKMPTKCQLQSLIGYLGHAPTVIKPGRTFLRHLLDIMKIPKRHDHKVRLNKQGLANIQWWSVFMEPWNGVLFFGGLPLGPVLVSDASGLWGCGAFSAPTGKWLQIRWPTWWREKSIAAKELLPIVVGATLWGKAWTGLQIPFICDNLGVVQALSSRCVRDPHIMHLLRCLFFIEAKFGFEHTASHIAGKNNGAADALSRDRIGVFHSLISCMPLGCHPLFPLNY